mgnify:CR=1 FL=1
MRVNANHTSSGENLALLLNQLQKVKQTGHDQYIALCPSHNDKNPSLAIRQTNDGRILIKCFAGCSSYEVVSAAGLSLTDLFPKESSHSKPIRNPFPATAVLRCIQAEALIVATAALNIAKGISLTQKDLDRLVLAASRIGAYYD